MGNQTLNAVSEYGGLGIPMWSIPVGIVFSFAAFFMVFGIIVFLESQIRREITVFEEHEDVEKGTCRLVAVKRMVRDTRRSLLL